MKLFSQTASFSISALALGLLCVSAQAQTLTKCTDANGAVTYQEGGCKGAAKEADVRITAPGIGGGLTNSEKAAAQSAAANTARANSSVNNTANSSSANRTSKSIDSTGDASTAIGSNSSSSSTRAQGLPPTSLASIEACPNVEEEKPSVEELTKINAALAAKKNTKALCEAALAQKKAKAQSNQGVYLVK